MTLEEWFNPWWQDPHDGCFDEFVGVYMLEVCFCHREPRATYAIACRDMWTGLYRRGL